MIDQPIGQSLATCSSANVAGLVRIATNVAPRARRRHSAASAWRCESRSAAVGLLASTAIGTKRVLRDGRLAEIFSAARNAQHQMWRAQIHLGGFARLLRRLRRVESELATALRARSEQAQPFGHHPAVPLEPAAEAVNGGR